MSSRGGPRFSTTHWASLTLVLEIGCRTLSVGQPATSRGFRGCVPWLTREGRGRGGSPFCPLGVSFQAGAVATLYHHMEGIVGHSEHMQRYGSVDSSGQQCMKTQENLFRGVAHPKDMAMSIQEVPYHSSIIFRLSSLMSGD